MGGWLLTDIEKRIIQKRQDQLEALVIEFRRRLERLAPASPELKQALLRLEETRMWVETAIARHAALLGEPTTEVAS